MTREQTSMGGSVSQTEVSYPYADALVPSHVYSVWYFGKHGDKRAITAEFVDIEVTDGEMLLCFRKNKPICVLDVTRILEA